MKSLLIAAAFTILRIQAQTENMEEAMEKCIKKSEINPEEVKNKKVCEINTEADHFAEYIDCFGKEMGLTDEDHTIKETEILEFKKNVEGIDPKLAQKTVDLCLSKSNGNGNSTAYLFTICSCSVIAMQEKQEKCIEDSKVDKELVEKYNNCIFEDDPQLKDYMVCYATELGILNSEGEATKTGLTGFLEIAGNIEDHDRISQIVDKCAAQKGIEITKCVCSETK